VYSFAFDLGKIRTSYCGTYFQIDFIIVTPEDFNISCFYLSYGDIGAIMGGVLKHWGVSFGGNGLTYDVCHTFGEVSTQLTKIVITKDPKEICDVAGVSSDILTRWFTPKTGGASDVTEEEFFDWVISSPLFYIEFWNARSQKWNGDCRRRTRDRPMYSRFLFEYLPKKFGIVPDLEYNPEATKIDFVSLEDRKKFVTSVLEKYNLVDTVEHVLTEKRQAIRAKELFSGKVVSEFFGVTGNGICETIPGKAKDLQSIIIALKTLYPDSLGSVKWLSEPDRTPTDVYRILVEYKELNY